MIRIGVLADTHVGEFLGVLPQVVLDALEGSDLILHAGDLSDGSVIRDLERIAPVVAVRGDHDLPSAPRLPRRAVIQVGRHRIGLIHGKRGGGARSGRQANRVGCRPGAGNGARI